MPRPVSFDATAAEVVLRLPLCGCSANQKRFGLKGRLDLGASSHTDHVEVGACDERVMQAAADLLLIVALRSVAHLPDLPLSWLSMRRDSCLSVPSTISPPALTTLFLSCDVNCLYSCSMACASERPKGLRKPDAHLGPELRSDRVLGGCSLGGGCDWQHKQQESHSGEKAVPL